MRSRPARFRRTAPAVDVGLLSLLGLVVYLPVIVRGGFAFDDWAAAARVLDPVPGHGALAATLDVTGPRAANALYVVSTFHLFGLSARAHVLLAVAIGVATAAAVRSLLLTYRAPRSFALSAAALVLVMPTGMVSKAWPAVAPDELSVLCFVLGLTLALRALVSGSAFMHAASLALYVCAALFKEVTLPWVALAVVWYVLAVPWRKALGRFAADIVILVPLIALMAALPAPAQGRTSPSTWPAHAHELVSEAFGGLSQLVSLEHGTHPVGGILAVAVAGAAAAAARRAPAARRAAAALGASVVALLVAVAVYVPANPALLPNLPGPTGRPGIALALPMALVVASLLAASVVALRAALPAWPTTIVLIPAAALFAAWCVAACVQTSREAGAWATAARRERAVLSAVQSAYPRPVHDATLVVLGAPPDVPISRAGVRSTIAVFQEPFVTTAAMRVTYGRADLFGVSVRPGDALRCTPSFLLIARPGYPFALTDRRERGWARSLYGLGRRFHTRGSLYNIPATSYGRLVVVDIRSDRAFVPRDALGCERALRLR